MRLQKILKAKYNRMIKNMESIADTIDITVDDLFKHEEKLKEHYLNILKSKYSLERKLNDSNLDEIKDDINAALEIQKESCQELETKITEIVKKRKDIEREREIILSKVECYESMKDIYMIKPIKTEDINIMDGIQSKLDKIKDEASAYKELYKKFK